MNLLMPNRRQRRREEAWRRKPPRDPRRGFGKHAMGGKSFRLLHVNWYKRVVKEMKDCPRVIDWVLSPKSTGLI